MKLNILIILVVLMIVQVVTGKVQDQVKKSQVTTYKNETVNKEDLLDNFFELNNKMLRKTNRSKRQVKIIYAQRPHGIKRSRFPFPPPPPIAKRRRFPKPSQNKIINPYKKPSKLRMKPVYGPPSLNYGAPVGYFLMNQNNEIVHKSKDLSDIPPQFLDKIIPPNFIKDSPTPQSLFAVEHEFPELLQPNFQSDSGNEQYQNKPQFLPPVTSYGTPINQHPQTFHNHQYNQYSSHSIEPNYPPSYEFNNNQNSHRGQSETPHTSPVKPQLSYDHQRPKKKPEFQLQRDPVQNSYDASVSSYDVPLNYVPADSKKIVRKKPVYNSGQSFVESYSSHESSESQNTPHPVLSKPPQLPAVYNQNEFKTINHSNNKKKVVYNVNTDNDEDHGLALEYPNSSEEEEVTESNFHNFGARFRPKQRPKKTPNKYEYIDSYEDPSISQESYYTSRTVETTPLTTTTRKHRVRTSKRPKTRPNLSHILDTDELKSAFKQGHASYRASSSKPSGNFVLLSSANPSPKTYRPYHHTTSTTEMNPLSQEDIDIISIQKSKSHSFYGGSSSSFEDELDSIESPFQGFGARKRSDVKRRKKPRRDPIARRDMNHADLIFVDSPRTQSSLRSTIPFVKTFSSKINDDDWKGHIMPINHKIP